MNYVTCRTVREQDSLSPAGTESTCKKRRQGKASLPLCHGQLAGSSHGQTRDSLVPAPARSLVPRWCRLCQCLRYLQTPEQVRADEVRFHEDSPLTLIPMLGPGDNRPQHFLRTDLFFVGWGEEFLETEYSDIVQADLELKILQPAPPKCWYHRCVASHLQDLRLKLERCDIHTGKMSSL